MARPPTRAGLMKYALAQVQRHGTTSRRLTETLERRVTRALGTDLEEALGWVGEVVSDLEAQGALDDKLYAELFARSLHRSGKSQRLIRARLAEKGVPRDLADRAVGLLGTEGDHVDGVDGVAATEFAKNRRFGAFRRTDVELDDARRRKELGAFARAGFSFDLAQKMVEADPADGD